MSEVKGQLIGTFPIPVWTGEIELELELPTEFGETNVVRKEYPELKDIILNITQDICEEMGFVRQEVKLNDMWVNLYDENRMHLAHHYHQNCAFTGTYYPEDANHNITILNPNAVLYQAHYPQRVEGDSGWNQDSITLTANKGQLVILPSYLGHEVWWNGKAPSKSISFDIAYQLPIGDKEYGSYSE